MVPVSALEQWRGIFAAINVIGDETKQARKKGRKKSFQSSVYLMSITDFIAANNCLRGFALLHLGAYYNCHYRVTQWLLNISFV